MDRTCNRCAAYIDSPIFRKQNACCGACGKIRGVYSHDTAVYIIHYTGICGAQISGAFGFFTYTECFRRNGYADDSGILSLFRQDF